MRCALGGSENAGVENAGVDSRGIATDEISR